MSTLAAFDTYIALNAYALQILFDFSGYSGMAIGIALLMGFRLPSNFDVPYRSASIIEFWRRWHITLSRFLREFVYIPMGGNRTGPKRRHVNLMATMLIGGIWHGAGWTFIVWGLLHGLYLWVAHLVGPLVRVPRALKILVTYHLVIFAWIFFRASDLASALTVVENITFRNGLGLPQKWSHFADSNFQGLYSETNSLVLISRADVNLMIVALFIAFFLPSLRSVIGSKRILYGYYNNVEQSTKRRRMTYTPNIFWTMFSVVLMIFSIWNIRQDSPFIYFQF